MIADQDASGPAGSDMTSLLVFLQSPEVKLLGITVVTGDAWRDEEVAHALRLLELIGRTDVKVYAWRRVSACAHVRGNENSCAALWDCGLAGRLELEQAYFS